MDLSLSPLVLTKLRVPVTRSHSVPRARLAEHLTLNQDAGLILVCAPAGYGKTTFLADWANSLLNKGTPVAWYALDPEDDEPLLFTSYLVAAFSQALGPIPELIQLAQILRASPEMELNRIIPALINTLVSADRECVLVLDDYHLIGAPPVHTALAYILEHLPENLQIAIGSRSDPPLPLARLRAGGQLVEVRTSDLRFTKEETDRFLNETMQLGLSAEGIAALEKRTEGWVTGLQLVALSLAGRADKEQAIASFTGSHRYLVSYLMEEVFTRQTEEVQSFLLSTSILARMSGDLCDALVHPENTAGAEILERLERTNLFVVPLDDRYEWYRYHHLFRDFLQIRLGKAGPNRISFLHRAACEWLVGYNLLREAARHAFQTQDWGYAAEFVEKYSFSLIVRSEISTVYEWCSAFPEEVMQSHPMLCILQGMALAYSFRRQNRERVQALLRQTSLVINVLEDPQVAHELIELASIVRTFLAFAPDPAADPAELFDLAQNFLDTYPEGHAGQFSGLLLYGYAHLAFHDTQPAQKAFEAAQQIALRESLFFGFVESTFHLACLAHAQGQLGLASEICRQGEAQVAAVLDNPEAELPAVGCLEIALGRVLLEQDHLAEAEAHLRHGLDLMGGGMNPYYMMAAHLTLFRLYQVQGKPAEALKYLDRLDATWPDIVFCTRGLRVLHDLRSSPDDPVLRANAAAWSQDFSSSMDMDVTIPGMGPYGAAEAYYLASLAWSQIQIALGNTQPVFSYLKRWLDRASVNGLADRMIELLMLQAFAWKAENDIPRALAALESALSIAQPLGYLRTFDRGPVLTQLLLKAASQGSCQDYARRILTRIHRVETSGQEQKEPDSRAARTPFGESLSERELEVLHLIAQGATNQEIADRLVITVGTVKSHINHILGKLSAHNRTEAVALAREFGLIEI